MRPLIPSGYFHHAPPMVEFCGKLYFNAKDSLYGEELWESDGTTAGTKIVADFAIGNADSYIRELMISNGRMYLFALDAQMVSSLWMIEECYTPTAVESINQEPLLCSIFPNPSDGSFSIAIPNVNKQMSVEVYDMMGLLVSQWSNLTDLERYRLDTTCKGRLYDKVTTRGNNIV
jgi:ELWxxDGT repeat protein